MGDLVESVVDAVAGNVSEVVSSVETFEAKAKKFFTSQDKAHLSDALVPIGAAVDGLKGTVIDLKSTIDNQALTITTLQGQVASLAQSVAKFTS